MNILEIILISIGTLVGTAGLHTFFRARRYITPMAVRRFDDI